MQNDPCVIAAMMFLEMAGDGGYERTASQADLICAAHSYLSLFSCGKHSWDGASPLLAKVQAESAIEDAMYASKSMGAA